MGGYVIDRWIHDGWIDDRWMDRFPDEYINPMLLNSD